MWRSWKRSRFFRTIPLRSWILFLLNAKLIPFFLLRSCVCEAQNPLCLTKRSQMRSCFWVCEADFKILPPEAKLKILIFGKSEAEKTAFLMFLVYAKLNILNTKHQNTHFKKLFSQKRFAIMYLTEYYICIYHFALC